MSGWVFKPRTTDKIAGKWKGASASNTSVLIFGNQFVALPPPHDLRVILTQFLTQAPRDVPTLSPFSRFLRNCWGPPCLRPYEEGFFIYHHTDRSDVFKCDYIASDRVRCVIPLNTIYYSPARAELRAGR